MTERSKSSPTVVPEKCVHEFFERRVLKNKAQESRKRQRQALAELDSCPPQRLTTLVINVVLGQKGNELKRSDFSLMIKNSPVLFSSHTAQGRIICVNLGVVKGCSMAPMGNLSREYNSRVLRASNEYCIALREKYLHFRIIYIFQVYFQSKKAEPVITQLLCYFCARGSLNGSSVANGRDEGLLRHPADCKDRDEQRN